jgi:hypothetical protein
MCPTMRTCVRLKLRPLYCPAVPGHASLTVPYGSQGSLSFGRPAIWQLERHSIAELAQCRRSLVRLLSRRSMPTAVHAYLFYPGRRQNSPAFKVIVEALKI